MMTGGTGRLLHPALRWRVLLLLGAAYGFKSRTFRHRNSVASPVRSARDLVVDNDDAGGCIQDTFVLPVFPLRKSVRMPSDSLTLNLYEPRYLELVGYVLEQEPRWFGALYCSKKPQFIQEGGGPIVPMVEAGDVGVVCDVSYDEDAMVPVSRNNVDGALRRRIKLKGLAIGRFRIEKVLHNGYGGGLLCDNDDNVKPLPFILVEASRVNDVPIPSGIKEEQQVIDLEKQLFTTILEREEVRKKMVASLWGDLVCTYDSDSRKEGDQAARRVVPLLPYHLVENLENDSGLKQQSRELQAVEKALLSWVDGSPITAQDQRRQLFSFVVSSAASVDNAMTLLNRTSTYDRLRHAYDQLQKNQSCYPFSLFTSIIKRPTSPL